MKKNLLIALTVITGLVISLTSCMLDDLDSLEQKALKANHGLTAVTIADIEGVTVSPNGKPVNTITENDQYSGTVIWSPNDAAFQLDESYTATIILTPKSGYTFKTVNANFFKVAGAESTVNKKESGIITAVFPPVKYVINISAIKGIPVPTPGGIPVDEITENDQYSGTVTWSPDAYTFVRGVRYTATITLTLKPNYSFKGIESDFFTVTGAESVVFDAKTGVITAKFPETEPITLTEGVWIKSDIKGNNSQQFKFTATSKDQFIHIDLGTLNNWNGINVYVQGGGPGGGGFVSKSETITSYYENKYLYHFNFMSGLTYNITVTNYSSYDGTYYITFSSNETPPLPSKSAEAVTLTAGIWEDGTVTSTSEEWYKFTATTYPQYIHANFGTLNSSYGMYVQVYDSTGSTVRLESNEASGYKIQLRSSNKYVYTSSITSGQTYYIKVTRNTDYDDKYSYTGTYQIGFNTSSNPPLPNASASAVTLSAGIWEDGTVTSTSEEWYKFTAASSGSHYIHANFVTLDSSAGMYVQVYYSTGGSVTSQLLNTSYNKYTSFSATSGQTYYIKVTCNTNYSYYSGTYQIAYHTSSTPPLPNNVIASAITLNAGIWTDGSLSSTTTEQWFKFTAASSGYHYIHPGFVGTLSSNYLAVRVYNSTGGTVANEVQLYDSNRYASFSVTSGETYYIKVVSSYTGTYQITYNTSSTPPSPSITLTADTWANGSVPYGGEQWIKFTATADVQYIHANFTPSSSVNGIYVQLYDSTGNNTVGSSTRLNNSNKNTSFSVTSGQTYYIKVTPGSSSNSSAYWITFSASSAEPSSDFKLTADVWADGTVLASGQQWFIFEATASSQYIHASFGTMNSSYSYGGIYVQLYDSNGSTVGYQTRLYSDSKYTTNSVISGQTYYIQVTPYSSSYTGTYKIAFNTSFVPPGVLSLTEDKWTNGNLTSSEDEQWFKFTATGSGSISQCIHASFGTFSSSEGIYVRAYNSTGSSVKTQTINSYSSLSYMYFTVTSGETYYIVVTPSYNPSNGGTYQISFNTSSIPPLPSDSASATWLTYDTWTESTDASEQWFKFTANTTGTQFIHASFDTFYNLSIQVYNSTGILLLNTLYNRYVSLSVTSEQTYYIKVTLSSSYSSTYKIAFNTLISPPGTPAITAGSWSNGNITSSSGEQWFNFKASVGTHYIHVSFGTLNDLYVDVYNSSGGSTDLDKTNLYGNAQSATLESLTFGQTYCIKVTPFSSSGTGTFKITVSTSPTPPSL